jgi:environmental stress-induced protein Ves
MRIQRSADHRVVPWDNGLGITADVFLSPPDVTRWTWRLSIADVTDDVPFSVMPGIDRHIMVAQGAGMGLVIDGGAEHRMDGSTPALSFDGESDTTCRLLDGPIADLNLMVLRGTARGWLRRVTVGAGRSFSTSRDDVAIVVLSGSVQVAGEDLATFDAVLLEDDDEVVVQGISDGVVAVAAVRTA